MKYGGTSAIPYTVVGLYKNPKHLESADDAVRVIFKKNPALVLSQSDNAPKITVEVKHELIDEVRREEETVVQVRSCFTGAREEFQAANPKTPILSPPMASTTSIQPPIPTIIMVRMSLIIYMTLNFLFVCTSA